MDGQNIGAEVAEMINQSPSSQPLQLFVYQDGLDVSSMGAGQDFQQALPPPMTDPCPPQMGTEGQEHVILIMGDTTYLVQGQDAVRLLAQQTAQQSLNMQLQTSNALQQPPIPLNIEPLSTVHATPDLPFPSLTEPQYGSLVHSEFEEKPQIDQNVDTDEPPSKVGKLDDAANVEPLQIDTNTGTEAVNLDNITKDTLVQLGNDVVKKEPVDSRPVQQDNTANKRPLNKNEKSSGICYSKIVVNSIGRFSCPLCPKMLPDSNSIYSHLKEMHNGDRLMARRPPVQRKNPGPPRRQPLVHRSKQLFFLAQTMPDEAMLHSPVMEVEGDAAVGLVQRSTSCDTVSTDKIGEVRADIVCSPEDSSTDSAEVMGLVAIKQESDAIHQATIAGDEDCESDDKSDNGAESFQYRNISCIRTYQRKRNLSQTNNSLATNTTDIEPKIIDIVPTTCTFGDAEPKIVEIIPSGKIEADSSVDENDGASNVEIKNEPMEVSFSSSGNIVVKTETTDLEEVTSGNLNVQVICENEIRLQDSSDNVNVHGSSENENTQTALEDMNITSVTKHSTDEQNLTENLDMGFRVVEVKEVDTSEDERPDIADEVLNELHNNSSSQLHSDVYI